MDESVEGGWKGAAEARGVVEMPLTFVDRDGTMTAYDFELIRSMRVFIDVPSIATGGAGIYSHLMEATKDGDAPTVAAFTGKAKIAHSAPDIRARRDYVRS
jgi:imidazole glycerol phosphate synthase subunit HisF